MTTERKKRTDIVRAWAQSMSDDHVRALKALTGEQIDQLRDRLRDLDLSRERALRCQAAADDAYRVLKAMTLRIDGWRDRVQAVVDAAKAQASVQSNPDDESGPEPDPAGIPE